MPNSVASVVWMTSFCTSPYSDTKVSCRMSSWRRLISGSCSASWVSATCRVPLSDRWTGATTVSSVGGAKNAAGCRARSCVGRGDAVADLDVGQTPQLADLTGSVPVAPSAP